MGLTRCSSASACRCVCVETCTNPCFTPAQSSQSSPRQQRSLLSTRLFIVFVRRARSACPSRKVVRRAPEVSPDKIDTEESASLSTEAVVETGAQAEPEAEVRPDDREDRDEEKEAANGGRGKGR